MIRDTNQSRQWSVDKLIRTRELAYDSEIALRT